MKKVLLIILIVSSNICIKANSNLDSLYTIWQDDTASDNIRTTAYINYIWDGFLFSDSDTAYVLAQNLLHFGKERSYTEAKAIAYDLMGVSHYLRSNYSEALNYYQKSLKIKEEIGDKNGISKTISNIGNIYQDQGNYSKALEYYLRSLKIKEEIGDIEGNAYPITNIGTIYKAQEEYTKALDYFQKGLKIMQEIDNKNGIATIFNNIGGIYQVQANYPNAIEFYNKSLKISEEIKDKKGAALTFSNIGVLYKEKENLTKALEYYHKSLKLKEEIGDKKGIAIIIYSIGYIYIEKRDYTKALQYCNKSLKISQEIGALQEEKYACKCLYQTYKTQGNANKALIYLEKIQIIEDSLNQQETGKKLQQMEFQKQVLEDSLAREKIIQLEKQKKEEIIQIKKRKNQIQYSLMLMFVLFLAALIAAMTKFSYKPKMAAALIFIFFILIFEFLLVVLNPWVDNITNGEVGFKIMLNTLIALLIFGIHQISGKKIKKILIK